MKYSILPKTDNDTNVSNIVHDLINQDKSLLIPFLNKAREIGAWNQFLLLSKHFIESTDNLESAIESIN